MRTVLLLVCLVLPSVAQVWTLDALYTRPYAWGSPPQMPTWSETGNTLVFRWNARGYRFNDLYSYRPGEQQPVRLTDMEGFEDELLIPPAELDERLRQYIAPPAGIGDFTVSDDGSLVAFSYRGELFTVPADGSEDPFRLTRSSESESSPEFSPSATSIASIRGGQIVVQDRTNAQLWQVTDVEDPESLLGYDWSPDGERFVYVTQTGSGRMMPLPNYSGRFVTAPPFARSVAGDEFPPMSIYLIGARGGEPVKVDMGDWAGQGYISMPSWSKDSTKLVYTHVDGTLKNEQIRVVDAATGKTTVVFEDSDPAWVYGSECGFSPDGTRVWFISERDGYAHIYHVGVEGGDPVQVTSGAFQTAPEQIVSFQARPTPPQWIGDYIYYPSTEVSTAERHLFRIRPDGTDKQQLSTREGVNMGTVSPDGSHIAWQIADLNTPGDLWVDETRVTHRPGLAFYEYPWPETRFVTFPSRTDGATVHAKLLLPPGYDPDTRNGTMWPCVFFIHGAGIATSVLKQWGSYHELRYVLNAYLANQDYVVMDLDYRGSTGYGRDWRTGVYLHMGGPDLEDVMGAVQYLDGLGNIDMSKLGIWGVSYGGFMTNMAMFLEPGTFQAGSAWAAVNDWENYNAGYTRERLNTPAMNPEAMRRSSPITFSGKLENHLLIVQGIRDSNVLFQDSVQLSEKLIQEGKPFGETFYPEEDHGFIRDETWIDATRRTVEWFDRYLKGQ